MCIRDSARNRHEDDDALCIRVQGRPSAEGEVQICCRPGDSFGPKPQETAPALRRRSIPRSRLARGHSDDSLAGSPEEFRTLTSTPGQLGRRLRVPCLVESLPSSTISVPDFDTSLRLGSTGLSNSRANRPQGTA